MENDMQIVMSGGGSGGGGYVTVISISPDGHGNWLVSIGHGDKRCEACFSGEYAEAMAKKFGEEGGWWLQTAHKIETIWK